MRELDDLVGALADELGDMAQAIRDGVARETAAIRGTCVLCGERSIRLPSPLPARNAL
ncbi:MAG: hypothetical protein HYY28_09330 [Betaproteobacteria bacterium]|nr:hypothetical protein [Betaproteobacteria bacterium]MBI2960502.1 hypothetical protein [Betaproteobacteria bacterium]